MATAIRVPASHKQPISLPEMKVSPKTVGKIAVGATLTLVSLLMFMFGNTVLSDVAFTLLAVALANSWMVWGLVLIPERYRKRVCREEESRRSFSH